MQIVFFVLVNYWTGIVQKVVYLYLLPKTMGNTLKMVDFIGQKFFLFFTGTTTSGSTTKKTGQPKFPKLPADANDLLAERTDGHTGWKPGMVTESCLVVILIMRI